MPEPTENDPTTTRTGEPADSPQGPGATQGEEDAYWDEQGDADRGDKDQQQG